MEAPDAVRRDGRRQLLPALERYADNPSAFLALNAENEHFTAPGVDGFVCYRARGRRWLQFGGPFTGEGEREGLQRRFLEHAHAQGRKVIGVQLQRADAELLAGLGLTVNQVGASYAVELGGFSLRGKRFVRLRNKISRALREGLEVAEVDADGHTGAIRDIDARWLRQKGRRTKELTFLIGEIGGEWQARRKLFVGRIGGRPVGYISYAPVHGSRPGWLHDLSRRLPECPPGVMEAINAHAVEHFRALGAPWLHFGFTPFTGLDDSHRLPTASPFAARVIRLLAERGERVYPAKSQVEYKLKWCPTVVLPEYFAFDGGISPRSLWSLARATNIV
ncbi:bifunctional lysylphosphatidylglycerol flippase/synthetase MprF [Actinosynnema sp.]|uniref:bifunctional lysylphosphatidylglycerol flippase/synthetase MprF n=1 Tax=Actinosynnema sp. TaxID=1872144 RepID=UPI003F845D16